MKKVLLLALCLCLLACGCSSAKVEEVPITENEDVYFGVITNTHLDLADTFGNKQDFEVDTELAYIIGCAVLESAYGELALVDGIQPFMYEVRDRDFYIVSYILPEDVGPGLMVAISKTDGQILRIWEGG